MSLDTVLKKLNVEALDEDAKQEINDTLKTLVNSKAIEIAQTKVDESLESEKEVLKETYEEKFEDYKKELTSHFSNFVDTIIEEEVEIPSKIYEFARKGELYSDVIETLKARIGIDENLINQEAADLLKEAKDEIISLREKLDEKERETLELRSDAQEMAASIYLHKKCDGLTESQKQQVLDILEGEFIVSNIDKKFDKIVESFSINLDLVSPTNEDNHSIGQEDASLNEEDNTNEDDTTISTSPWEQAKQNWIKTIRDGKI